MREGQSERGTEQERDRVRERLSLRERQCERDTHRLIERDRERLSSRGTK